MLRYFLFPKTLRLVNIEIDISYNSFLLYQIFHWIFLRKIYYHIFNCINIRNNIINYSICWKAIFRNVSNSLNCSHTACLSLILVNIIVNDIHDTPIIIFIYFDILFFNLALLFSFAIICIGFLQKSEEFFNMIGI